MDNRIEVVSHLRIASDLLIIPNQFAVKSRVQGCPHQLTHGVARLIGNQFGFHWTRQVPFRGQYSFNADPEGQPLHLPTEDDPLGNYATDLAAHPCSKHDSAQRPPCRIAGGHGLD